jgi:hypothetical protein
MEDSMDIDKSMEEEGGGWGSAQGEGVVGWPKSPEPVFTELQVRACVCVLPELMCA